MFILNRNLNYYVYGDKTCDSCDSSCLTCKGPLDTNCLTCNGTFRDPVTGKCVKTC